MSLNINKKNYRLADMSIPSEETTPYPDPDESVEHIEDRINMACYGTELHIREWRGADGLVEQFAIMLNITQMHPCYTRCEELKSDESNFLQVRRTDTWHSSIHSHQYFIDSSYCEREVHERLAGGPLEGDSRRIVNGTFRRYYYKMQYEQLEYLDRWEAGAP